MFGIHCLLVLISCGCLTILCVVLIYSKLSQNQQAAVTYQLSATLTYQQ